MAEQIKIESEQRLKEYYENMSKWSKKEVVIKRPECSYEDKRSDNMLKVKPVYDEEALS